MKLSPFLFSLFAPAALAFSTCLNEDYDHDPVNITNSQAVTAAKQLHTRETAQIYAYVHVLVSEAPKVDYGPGINNQFAYLNRQFNKWGYNINLRKVTFVIHKEWASEINVDKENKMRYLHRGDYQTLNIYMVEKAAGGVCSLPQNDHIPVEQQKLDFDGCFVSLAVGTSSTSATLTHEIGHWLGLLHVFQGGCEGSGDVCNDTAPQNGPASAHPATPGNLNTCPAKETCGAGKGLQNVKNFMDYSDCAQEFTACQGGRMHIAWYSLRLNRQLAAGVKVTW
ncbi:hypothetical protein BU24DRAFT_480207 [Aaosphaeria arxii CBS 175.79]|uniref:Peptidase M43 pregnancy-associated plasma-A domain-containing protein n=1 Tax=Aaosphaeria arxii CBS 175.79 TaxID=1450172 RepID=A0A6A5XRA3_9PLEO|nr:uncharacterized protein BU24DRAFT_480207 [Aaosphaeria arxii CBS 175.79]KAF2015426.1 hypothetical protein BU24DRAFT_480207 [Aaosphaeria arxii CBS 175.79]